jgi:hypothetical protein
MNIKFLIFIVCFTALFKTTIKPFKIDRVILSANTDSELQYDKFWPLIAKSWKEIIGVKPTLAFIAPDNVMIDETLGDVIRFEPIPGIPTSLYAQVIRLLLPIYFEEDGCIISDIDMMPINKKYFIDLIASVPDDNFIVYRNKAYLYGNRYPMCYVAGKGKTFKEIFQIQSISQIPELVKFWHSLNLGWNTDEVLLYYYLNNWNKFKTKCTMMNHTVQPRIDRDQWQYSEELIKLNYYIEAHLPRPYDKYKKEIDALAQVIFSKRID